MAGNLGMMAAGAVTGALGNLAGQGMQARQQERLMSTQIKGAKEMADYNQQKQLEMWNATNYAAQKEHMKAAGLNPALMYGMGGQGGATTGAGQSGMPTGGMAENGGMGMATGLNAAMVQSQIKLNESAAKKNEAEANKTTGIDTLKAGAETKNIEEATKLIGEQLKSNKLGQIGQRLQNDFDEIRNLIASETQEQQIGLVNRMLDNAEWQLNKLINEVDISETEASIKAETRETIIQMFKQDLKNAQVEMLLKNSQINVNEAQAKSIAEAIEQGWKKLSIDKMGKEMDYEAKIKAVEGHVKATLESSENIKSGMIWSSVIGQGGQVIKEVIKMGGKGLVPIQGFGTNKWK